MLQIGQTSQLQTAQSEFHPTHKILIAEDLAPMRLHMKSFLQEMLSKADAQIIEMNNREDFVSLVLREQPDLLIIDACMAELDAIAVAGEIWQHNSQIRILFWCHDHREIYWRKIAKILPVDAVYGYITKSSGDCEMKAAISSLLLFSNSYMSPQLSLSWMRVSKRGQALTDIDMETLQDICLGLTDKLIAARRNMTLRGVHNRVLMLQSKLLRGQHAIARHDKGMDVFNARVRTIFEAFSRGLIDLNELADANTQLSQWLNGFEAP